MDVAAPAIKQRGSPLRRQYVAPGAAPARTPEAALWCAVICQALHDATAVSGREYNAARAWLLSRSPDLRVAIEGANLDLFAFSDRIVMLAARGWRMSARRREALRA